MKLRRDTGDDDDDDGGDSDSDDDDGGDDVNETASIMPFLESSLVEMGSFDDSAA